MEGIEIDRIEACSDFIEGVATKDVAIGRGEGSTWVRIYLPEREFMAASSSDKKSLLLPLVLYFHGGAYCLGDPDWPFFHNFCKRMAVQSGCVWISASYRLAPRHRLPAAYDDGLHALLWLRDSAVNSSADPWLSPDLVDYSAVFLAGESAGATIVFNIAMRAAASGAGAPESLLPLRVKGLLLVHPGFHSSTNAGSMIDSDSGDLGDLNTEAMYEMSLPLGETLDYAAINPVHVAAPPLTPLSAYPSLLVAVAELDFRYKLTLEFYERVKEVCADVELFVTPAKPHAFHILGLECPEAHELRTRLVDYIHSRLRTHSTSD